MTVGTKRLVTDTEAAALRQQVTTTDEDGFYSCPTRAETLALLDTREALIRRLEAVLGDCDYAHETAGMNRCPTMLGTESLLRQLHEDES